MSNFKPIQQGVNIYDEPKIQSRKTVVISTCDGQPYEGQNEQQQLQPANHSSDNAET